MNPMITLLRVGVVVTFVCTGLWLYVESDMKRFRESLPPPPGGNEELSIKRDAEVRFSGDGSTEPLFSTELSTAPIAPDTPTPESESTIAGSETDWLFDNEDISITGDPFSDTDVTDVPDSAASPAAPYDLLFVKAGFSDYNTYLHTNPEYAYQRLDEAFREQYGDDPDVDILVESARRYNEGAVPIETAIRFAEAQLRLLSKFEQPEPIEALQDHIEMLRETQQYGLETGEKVVYRSNYRFVSE